MLALHHALGGCLQPRRPEHQGRPLGKLSVRQGRAGRHGGQLLAHAELQNRGSKRYARITQVPTKEYQGPRMRP